MTVEEGSMIIVDGDFPSEKGECAFHCSPTCHPAQVGPEWVYGCLHPAWPSNKERDFCPIVKCDGVYGKCEVPKKFLGAWRGGLVRRQNNLKEKLADIEEQLAKGNTPFASRILNENKEG